MWIYCQLVWGGSGCILLYVVDVSSVYVHSDRSIIGVGECVLTYFIFCVTDLFQRSSLSIGNLFV